VQGDPRFTEYGDVDAAEVVVSDVWQGPWVGVGGPLHGPRGYDCGLEVHGFNDTVVAGGTGRAVRQSIRTTRFLAVRRNHFFHGPVSTDAFRAEMTDSSMWSTASPPCVKGGRDAVEAPGWQGSRDGVVAARCPLRIGT